MAKTPPHSVHTAQRDADKTGMKAVPAALGSKGRLERRSERALKRSRLARADGSAIALQRRFEAAVFDWDGTAVTDRQADASELRELFAELLEAGFDLAIITGTHIGNVDGQLALRPQGPGRIIVACNRGSEVYELTSVGPVPLERRVASAAEDEMLDRAAELATERLGEKGLTVSVISDRLNRRKIDLIPLPKWADPPKAELPKLLAAVEARLAAAGIDGLPEAVELVRACGLEAGLSDPRVTSDAKYAEIGLTDKTHSARYVISWLARRGIRPEQVLIGGDEFGSLGNCPGSDSLMLVPETAGAVCFSVGPEPEGTPEGVLNLGGGPELFADILANQLQRRREGELPQPVDEQSWQVVIDGQGGIGETVRETVLAMADGRIGTRGSLLTGSPNGPAVLAGGRYAGRGSEEQLLAAPIWNRIEGAAAEHVRRVLDLRTGTLRHELVCDDGSRLSALLFHSLARPGTACLRARGPEKMLSSSNPLAAPEQEGTETSFHRLGDVTIAESANVERIVAAAAEKREKSLLERVVSYGGCELEPLTSLQTANAAGFERLYTEQRERWGERWLDANVVIEGDPELQLAVRYSLFGLISAAADSGEAAVGAGALSGSRYHGHIFWDTDVFSLPFFAATHPASARAMLRYRLNRLEPARAAAQASGRAGARFPWESTRSGLDVTPQLGRLPGGEIVAIRTGRLEEHITADVAWAADCYLAWSGDEAFAGDAQTLFVEAARYWASRIRADASGAGHIYTVIGPDEYHEPVDDSSFTNVMARWTLRRAARSLQDRPRADIEDGEVERWLQLADRLTDGYNPETMVYEEFAGFNKLEPIIAAELSERPFAGEAILPLARLRNSQVVKQADVVLLHHLVPEEVAEHSLGPNLAFYEPRTSHGSSLSPAAFALLLARNGQLEQAEEYLRMAAGFDLEDRNRTSSCGLHTATMGGTWQALAYGFCGLRPHADALAVDPHIPEHWRALELTVRFRGTRVRVRAELGRTLVWADEPVQIAFGASGTLVEAGPEGIELKVDGSVSAGASAPAAASAASA
jgi:trehalose/maltose hydrolase-like predicted phosphorylase/hydroxymethylpyrimidine pyrophosphatase-like HAD family hydrolase